MRRILSILLIAIFSFVFWIQDANAQANNTNTECPSLKCDTYCCAACSACANGHTEVCQSCFNRCPTTG